jgi:hypothetical protein
LFPIDIIPHQPKEREGESNRKEEEEGEKNPYLDRPPLFSLKAGGQAGRPAGLAAMAAANDCRQLSIDGCFWPRREEEEGGIAAASSRGSGIANSIAISYCLARQSGIHFETLSLMMDENPLNLHSFIRSAQV